MALFAVNNSRVLLPFTPLFSFRTVHLHDLRNELSYNINQLLLGWVGLNI
jgi:hypothetical protein